MENNLVIMSIGFVIASMLSIIVFDRCLKRSENQCVSYVKLLSKKIRLLQQRVIDKDFEIDALRDKCLDLTAQLKIYKPVRGENGKFTTRKD